MDKNFISIRPRSWVRLEVDRDLLRMIKIAALRADRTRNGLLDELVDKLLREYFNQNPA